MAAFVQWFNTLAVTHRAYLSHMYLVLTTQNTTDLVMDPDNAPDRFQMFVTKNDFPLRIVSRMVMVRAVMDFLFVNHDQLVPGTGVIGSNLVDIADRQWEMAFDSWKDLRSVELSDPYIRLWLQSELSKGP